jgi:hypothetical protein
MCGDGGPGNPTPPGDPDIIDLSPGTNSVNLPGGQTLTINSPVAVTVNKNPDPSSYPPGSTLTPIQITGTLGLGETADISFEDPNGFGPNEKIAFVDTNGKWTLVTSTLSPDGKVLTATVDRFSIWAPVDPGDELQIISTDPDDDDTDVEFNSSILANFNGSVDASSVIDDDRFIVVEDSDGSTLTENDPLVSIDGVVQCAGTTATFTPDSDLLETTLYMAKIEAGVESEYINSNALQADYTWFFTTAAVPDTEGPEIVTVSPEGVSVGVDAFIEVEFNESLDPATISEDTFFVNDGDGNIAGTITYDGPSYTITFTPDEPLAYNTTHTVTVLGYVNGVKDLAGNILASYNSGWNYEWSFTTEEKAVTITFNFTDHFSGDLVGVGDVHMYVNGQDRSSNSDGQIILNGFSPMQLEGYMDDEPIYTYRPDATYYLDLEFLDDFDSTISVLPSFSMPAPILLSGEIMNKSGSPLYDGSVAIYTDDGREVGGGEALGDGYYEGEVLTAGELYCTVEDYETGVNYYSKIDVQEGLPLQSPDISYSGTDISFSGSVPGAENIEVNLQLGEELIWLAGWEIYSGSFSISVPHYDSDVIRLVFHMEDDYDNDFEYYDPVEYTASSSGINYNGVFNTTSPVAPSSWAHNLSWDDSSQTLTWDSAGATIYNIEFLDNSFDDFFIAIDNGDDGGDTIENAPVDEDETVLITAVPVWSEEGYLDGFMPADRASGLVITYNGLAARYVTDNDIDFIHFDASDVPQTIASNAVTAIAVDDDNEVVLIGTYGGGISYLADGMWGQFTVDEGLVSNAVRALAVDYDAGGVWVGAGFAGVTFVDMDTGASISYTPSDSDLVNYNVSSVTVDTYRGGVWIGTQGGASYLDYGSDPLSSLDDSWTTYTNASTGGGLAEDSVKDIGVNNFTGEIWFCTETTGVSCLDGIGGSWVTYTTTDGLAYNGVEAVEIDDEGGVWFGTRAGANYFDSEGVWHTYRTQQGLVNNFVSEIFIDPDGGVWICAGYNAATGGVSHFDEYGFVSFSSGENALSDGYVTAVAVNGGIWFGIYGGGVDYLP